MNNEIKLPVADKRKANTLIKKFLKEKFGIEKPKVKFESFSQGSSYYISWSYGVCERKVEAEMKSLLSWGSNFVYDGHVISGARFVSCSRELNKDFVETIALYLGENSPLTDEFSCNTTSDITCRFTPNQWVPICYTNTSYREIANMLLSNVEFPFYDDSKIEFIELPKYEHGVFSLTIQIDNVEYIIRKDFKDLGA